MELCDMKLPSLKARHRRELKDLKERARRGQPVMVLTVCAIALQAVRDEIELREAADV